VPRSEFYNRQSSTINRQIYADAVHRTRSPSPTSGLPSPPHSARLSPTPPTIVHPTTPALVAPRPLMMPPQLVPHQPHPPPMPSAAPLVPPPTAPASLAPPPPIRGRGSTTVSTAAPVAVPQPPRTALPQLLPNLSKDVTGAIELAAEGGATPDQAAGAMGALFEAAVRLAWGSSPRDHAGTVPGAAEWVDYGADS
jgi:hypothetical protein